MPQKKHPHQSDTERIEVQTPDDEVVQTGILPAVAYGHAGTGMCPSSIQHKRTMAADSCGKRIKTACTTTILLFHFGESGDPGIWFPLDQLRTWLELQGEEMEHGLGKIDVARAWAAASANMKKKSRWSMVRGPMTATMATLYDLSIIPVSSWKWYPAENPDVDWTYSVGDPFLSEMQQRLSHKAWEQAALHYQGLGAENGVDMTILHKHYKQLVARGAHVRAGMLYKIATAQNYDGSRVREHDLDAQVACALCGSPDDSMFHRVYDCPCTPTSFVLDKTDQIVDEARVRARSCPHLSSWTKRIELSTKRERKLTPVPSSGFVASRRVAGTPSCQSLITRSLRILARCTSWAVMFSQMGAGELRPKTPAQGAAAATRNTDSRVRLVQTRLIDINLM